MIATPLRWISEVEPSRLAIMARPRGGEWLSEEVAAWRSAGVSAVVSLLERSEVRELGLESEGELCERLGIAFVSFPIPDRGVPSSVLQTQRLVDEIVSHLRAASPVAVHCRAGIGRTGLIAGCVLRAMGIPYESVFGVLTRVRGVPVPDTPAQELWVKQHGGGAKNAL